MRHRRDCIEESSRAWGRIAGIGWLACAAWFAAIPATAQDLVGARYKLTTTIEGSQLDVVRVQARDARRDPNRGSLSGQIGLIDGENELLRMGPARVRWTPLTEFEGIDVNDLRTDLWIEARVRRDGDGTLVAERIESASGSSGTLQILGTVTAAVPIPKGGTALTILGVECRVPSTIAILDVSLTRDPEDRRPTDQLALDVLGRRLTIGGELSTRIRHQGGLELADGADDDSTDFEVGAQLELFYEAHPHVSMFLEAKATHERDLYIEGGPNSSDWELERGETWLYARIPEVSGLSLQLGRQAFREPREWWWDADLDAIRLYWNGFPYSFEIGLAQELGRVSTAEDRIDPEEEDVLRVLGRAGWAWHPDHQLDLFALYQADESKQPSVGERTADDREDRFDANLLWLGVRASGDRHFSEMGSIDYWIDLAHVRGRETAFGSAEVAGGIEIDSRRSSSVRGWALDTGLTWRPPHAEGMAFSVGQAIGSGDDDPGDGRDRSFRQTGLNDNNGRFQGVNRFRYYGELLDPELSNLQISTLSLGRPILSSSWVELTYHYYRQTEAVASLRGTDLDARPEGQHRSIGHELDLIVGLEEWEHLEIEAVTSVFRAGSAFGRLSGELGYGGFIRLDWNF